MRLFLFLLCTMAVGYVRGDNFRILGAVKVTAETEDVADVELQVTWANSWRNEVNYDAIYLFGKYRTLEDDAWTHVFFQEEPEGYEVSPGFELRVNNGGRGIFLYRNTDDQGEATVTLRLKWKIKANEQHPLTQELIGKKQVLLSMHGLEMVYVPTGPFYAGDGVSEKGFTTSAFGAIPPEYDIIGTSTTFVYSANGGETSAAQVRLPADRYNQGVLNTTSRHDWCGTVFPAWWRVDFTEPREIRYFGVSGVCWQEIPCIPDGDWVLEASNDAKAWEVLWQGGPEYWGQSAVSYPVQKALRLNKTGKYRYYQIRVDKAQNASLWNNIRIANVAMTEKDLEKLEIKTAVLMDGRNPVFPENYPEGVDGFYAMKYELTQEQYVVFLNQLNRSAQYSRTIGGLLDRLEEGNYIFGERYTQASARNGIIVRERRLNSGRPFVFACDLNPQNIPDSEDDGQTLACNFLSIADMLAYADWCGLRPLSELEYEKMGRGNYPLLPQAGEWAAGTGQPQEVTGLTNERETTEKPVNAEANVNAGGKLAGPSRVGMFVRPEGRIHTGNSFWGFSDLSGNLQEIYCSVESLGKQFQANVPGSGQLPVNGMCSIDRGAWPIEVEAYGVRGGDFDSEKTALAISDRRLMSNYFKQLNERKANVGFRLGASGEKQEVYSVLTLENGLAANTIVYDTVCDGSDYVIRGNVVPGNGVVYLWYRSEDEGKNWKILKGEFGTDLKLKRLTDEVVENEIRRFLFKRAVYTTTGQAESTVGLLVTHGYRADRLRDTIQPCMATQGFTLTTPLPAFFEWTLVDGNKLLYRSENPELTSHYEVKLVELQEKEEMPSGNYVVAVKMKMAGRCEMRTSLDVDVLPFTSDPFPVKDDVFSFDASGNFKVDEGRWGGDYSWSWKLYSEVHSHKIEAATGIMSGKSDTLCNIVVGVTCDDCPDVEWKKNMKEQRDYNYVGAKQEVLVLSGSYQMECWGAQGGTACQDWSTTASGGYGGYAKGILDLMKDKLFYLYVGGYGGGNGAGPGWNGGGKGGANNDGEPGGSGGGASDIRLDDHLYSRIMVAGGGGGASNKWNGPGGGGITGNVANVAAGTQTSGYSLGTGGTGGRDTGGHSGGGGGGGGYWGGLGAGTEQGPGGGGSGFVSGMTGCNAIDEQGQPTGQPNHYSGFSFKNAEMLNGQRGGNGLIRITVK